MFDLLFSTCDHHIQESWYVMYDIRTDMLHVVEFKVILQSWELPGLIVHRKWAPHTNDTTGISSNRLFKSTTKETSKLRISDPLWFPS